MHSTTSVREKYKLTEVKVVHEKIQNKIADARLVVLATVLLKSQASWDVAPCRLVNSYRRYSGPQRLSLRGQVVIVDPDSTGEGNITLRNAGKY
jgi:hypothetical protein